MPRAARHASADERPESPIAPARSGRRAPRARRRRSRRGAPEEHTGLAFTGSLGYRAVTDAGWSSPVARRAHNPKVAGSNPAPATQRKGALLGASFFFVPAKAA